MNKKSSKVNPKKKILYITLISLLHLIFFINSFIILGSYSSQAMRFGKDIGILGHINNVIFMILYFPVSLLFELFGSIGIPAWIFIGLNSIIWGVALYYGAIGVWHLWQGGKSA